MTLSTTKHPIEAIVDDATGLDDLIEIVEWDGKIDFCLMRHATFNAADGKQAVAKELASIAERLKRAADRLEE